MNKQWTPIIHRDYNYSLRHVVSDEDRYQLSIAIWDRLIEVDDPTKGATPVPNRPGRFTVELMDYIIAFEVPVDANGKVLEDATEIRLLPIDTIK
ncbi:hypothetical protein KFU94_00150 [Chloroflexi bacterium TSY]|nr:hypothetical protein [Chloroflexi bacterium TSY]